MPETLHGDAPLPDGMLLLPRHACSATPNVGIEIAQPDDGGRPRPFGTIDASQRDARESPQSFCPEPRPDDTLITAKEAKPYGTMPVSANTFAGERAHQGGVQILQHLEQRDAPRAGDADSQQQAQLNVSTAEAALATVVRDAAALFQTVQGRSSPPSFFQRSWLPVCESNRDETQSLSNCISTSAGSSPPENRSHDHVALPPGIGILVTSGGGDNSSLGQAKPLVEETTGCGGLLGHHCEAPPEEGIKTVGAINKYILGPLIHLSSQLPMLYKDLCSKLPPQFLQEVQQASPGTPPLVYLRRPLET